MSMVKQEEHNILLVPIADTHRMTRDRLSPRLDGRGPLKLLYPRSNTFNSFSSPIPIGIIPENELLRKFLQGNTRVIQCTFIYLVL